MSKNLKNNNGLDPILVQNSLYQSIAKTSIVSLPLFAVASLLSACFSVWVMLNPPEPQYFATENGKLTPLVPTNKPYVDNVRVTQWVTEALTHAYRWDFQNWREQFAENQAYFTDEGFEAFKNEMSRERLPMTVNNGLVVGLAVTAAPIVVATTVANGVYLWKVRVPAVITMSNKNKQSSTKVILTVVVARVLTSRSANGIAISQIVEKAE